MTGACASRVWFTVRAAYRRSRLGLDRSIRFHDCALAIVLMAGLS